MFKKVGSIGARQTLNYQGIPTLYKVGNIDWIKGYKQGTPLYVHEPIKLPKFIAERLDLVIKADGIVDVIRSQEFYFDSYELNPEIVSWYNKDENYRKISEALLYEYEIEDEK